MACLGGTPLWRTSCVWIAEASSSEGRSISSISVSETGPAGMGVEQIPSHLQTMSLVRGSRDPGLKGCVSFLAQTLCCKRHLQTTKAIQFWTLRSSCCNPRYRAVLLHPWFTDFLMPAVFWVVYGNRKENFLKPPFKMKIVNGMLKPWIYQKSKENKKNKEFQVRYRERK